MPDASRTALDSLGSLPDQVVILEGGSEPSPQSRDTKNPESKNNLAKRDVSVQIGPERYPTSEAVWVNTSRPVAETGRYLERFRIGLVTYPEGEPVSALWMYLVEVHQDFGRSGNEPRANFWMFPVSENETGEFSLQAIESVRFAPNRLLDEALADSQWRVVFAQSYARLVRAVPALAALLIGCAALGSLLFALWRSQPWAVAATTVTFVLPILSAAPFLTSFGWMPIVAAVLLGYILTVAIACAIEQRLVPVLREKLEARPLQRILEALLIPAVALIFGTSLVISFASVSVIEWQGLGSASPGELFMASLIRPAIGLLVGGFGSCLILAVFHWLLSWRRRLRH